MADISYYKHGKVRLIIIRRADKMNSLDFAANDALIEIWRAFEADQDARVAVITGDVPMGSSPEQALEGIRLLMLANFSELHQRCAPAVFGAGPTATRDLVGDQKLELGKGLLLKPYQFLWIVYPE